MLRHSANEGSHTAFNTASCSYHDTFLGSASSACSTSSSRSSSSLELCLEQSSPVFKHAEYESAQDLVAGQQFSPLPNMGSFESGQHHYTTLNTSPVNSLSALTAFAAQYQSQFREREASSKPSTVTSLQTSASSAPVKDRRRNSAVKLRPYIVRNTSCEKTSEKKHDVSRVTTRWCVVCGKKANGRYFGAYVCLPCKSFYIRCMRDRKCVMQTRCDGRCDMQTVGRNRCQVCRLQRCLSAGMTRKEKPESIVPDNGQVLCSVCNDIASGLHFGVASCEGCKKFFRRSTKKHHLYKCKGRGKCAINPRMRTSCRYCRFQQCLRVGMCREAIKMGRPKKCELMRTRPSKTGLSVGSTSMSQNRMHNMDTAPGNADIDSAPKNSKFDSIQRNANINSAHRNVDMDSIPRNSKIDFTQGNADIDSTQTNANIDSTHWNADIDSIPRNANINFTQRNADIDSTQRNANINCTQRNADIDSTQRNAGIDSIQMNANIDPTQRNANIDSTQRNSNLNSTQRNADIVSIPRYLNIDSTPRNAKIDPTQRNADIDPTQRNANIDSTQKNAVIVSTPRNANSDSTPWNSSFDFTPGNCIAEDQVGLEEEVLEYRLTLEDMDGARNLSDEILEAVELDMDTNMPSDDNSTSEMSGCNVEDLTPHLDQIPACQTAVCLPSSTVAKSFSDVCRPYVDSSSPVFRCAGQSRVSSPAETSSRSVCSPEVSVPTTTVAQSFSGSGNTNVGNSPSGTNIGSGQCGSGQSGSDLSQCASGQNGSETGHCGSGQSGSGLSQCASGQSGSEVGHCGSGQSGSEVGHCGSGQNGSEFGHCGSGQSGSEVGYCGSGQCGSGQPGSSQCASEVGHCGSGQCASEVGHCGSGQCASEVGLCGSGQCASEVGLCGSGQCASVAGHCGSGQCASGQSSSGQSSSGQSSSEAGQCVSGQYGSDTGQCYSDQSGSQSGQYRQMYPAWSPESHTALSARDAQQHTQQEQGDPDTLNNTLVIESEPCSVRGTTHEDACGSSTPVLMNGAAVIGRQVDIDDLLPHEMDQLLDILGHRATVSDQCVEGNGCESNSPQLGSVSASYFAGQPQGVGTILSTPETQESQNRQQNLTDVLNGLSGDEMYHQNSEITESEGCQSTRCLHTPLPVIIPPDHTHTPLQVAIPPDQTHTPPQVTIPDNHTHTPPQVTIPDNHTQRLEHMTERNQPDLKNVHGLSSGTLLQDFTSGDRQYSTPSCKTKSSGRIYDEYQCSEPSHHRGITEYSDGNMARNSTRKDKSSESSSFVSPVIPGGRCLLHKEHRHDTQHSVKPSTSSQRVGHIYTTAVTTDCISRHVDLSAQSSSQKWTAQFGRAVCSNQMRQASCNNGHINGHGDIINCSLSGIAGASCSSGITMYERPPICTSPLDDTCMGDLPQASIHSSDHWDRLKNSTCQRLHTMDNRLSGTTPIIHCCTARASCTHHAPSCQGAGCRDDNPAFTCHREKTCATERGSPVFFTCPADNGKRNTGFSTTAKTRHTWITDMCSRSAPSSLKPEAFLTTPFLCSDMCVSYRGLAIVNSYFLSLDNSCENNDCSKPVWDFLEPSDTCLSPVCQVCGTAEVKDSKDGDSRTMWRGLCLERHHRYWHGCRPSKSVSHVRDKSKHIMDTVNSAFCVFRDHLGQFHRTYKEYMEDGIQTGQEDSIVLKMLYTQASAVTAATRHFLSNLLGTSGLLSEDVHLLSEHQGLGSALIALSWQTYHADCRRFRELWTWSVSRKSPLNDFKERLLAAADALHNLAMDLKEAALVCALSVCSTDTEGLKSKTAIGEMRSVLLDSLQIYISSRDQWPEVRVQRLFSVMPEVRLLSAWHLAILGQIQPAATPGR